MTVTAPILELVDVEKHFGGVPALAGVSFSVRRGGIHALVGENGAGKSTLVKIMSGVHQPDAGQVLLDGEPVVFGGPSRATQLGIHLVHQELALLPESSVVENVFLGMELRGRGPILNWTRMRKETEQALERLGCQADPWARVGRLPVAQRQLVEIARALVGRARVLILDEPTAALAPKEVDRLFAVLRALREEGHAIVYISHRLDEVLDLADEVTVLKDGRHVATRPVADLTAAEIVRLMVGRPIEDLFPPRSTAPGREVVLAVEGLSDPPNLHQVDLELRAGEIVGIAGLQGQGQDELLACLAGDRRPVRSRIRFLDRNVKWSDVRSMVQRGVGLVPGDRKTQGLLLEEASHRNAALPALPLLSRLGVIRRGAERAYGDAAARRVGVRGNLDLPVSSLSGGNQQKVVLAKWLALDTRVLLLNQPTRGVDVGAKSEIYGVLRNFADAGGAVLMTSQELTEVLGLSDRVLVMRQGRLVSELPGGATEEAVMAAAVGA